LLEALDFVAGYLGQKCTPAALADEFIYAGIHVNRKDDARSSAQILRHTHSLTYPAGRMDLNSTGFHAKLSHSWAVADA
jgi:hypothetical protein